LLTIDEVVLLLMTDGVVVLTIY